MATDTQDPVLDEISRRIREGVAGDKENAPGFIEGVQAADDQVTEFTDQERELRAALSADPWVFDTADTPPEADESLLDPVTVFPFEDWDGTRVRTTQLAWNTYKQSRAASKMLGREFSWMDHVREYRAGLDPTSTDPRNKIRTPREIIAEQTEASTIDALRYAGLIGLTLPFGIAGQIAGRAGGLLAAEAMGMRFGAMKGLQSLGASALAETTGAIGAGAVGGAAQAAFSGIPIREWPEHIRQSAAIAAPFGLIPTVGIPALAGSTYLAGKALKQIPFIERRVYPTLEAIRATEKTLPKATLRRLGDEKLSEVRRSAAALGMQAKDYPGFVDEAAQIAKEWPENAVFLHRFQEASEKWVTKLQYERAWPPLPMPPAGHPAQKLFPLPAEAATDSAFQGWNKVRDWVRNKVDPLTRKLGIATSDAVSHAQASLREWAGQLAYTRLQAENDILAPFLAMRPEARKRSGELLSGLTRGKAKTLTPGEAARFEKMGPLTFDEEVRKIRADKILTEREKEQALLSRVVLRDMEQIIKDEKIGPVHGQGIHRARYWLPQQIAASAQTGAPLRLPKRIKPTGKAFEARQQPILELDQRTGGAWWIMKGDRPIERFTTPGARDARIAALKQNGERVSAANPVLWDDAVKSGLVVESGFPEAVNIWEAGSDIVHKRLYRNVASHPDLVRKPGPLEDVSKPPAGFLHIPKDAAYGPLSNKWVHRRVGEHILDVNLMNSSVFQDFMTRWRFARLVQNPSTHFRNIFTNMMFLNHPAIGAPIMSPVSIAHAAEAVEDIARKGPFYREMLRHGLIGGELGETATQSWRGYIDLMKKRGNALGLFDRMEQSKGIASNIYSAEDQLFQLWGARYRMALGDSPLEAVESVRAAFPDYRVMHRYLPLPKRIAYGGAAEPGAAGALLTRPGSGLALNPFFRFTMESARSLNNAARMGPEGLMWFLKWYGLVPAAITGAGLAATGMSLPDLMRAYMSAPKWRGTHWWVPLSPFTYTDHEGKERKNFWDLTYGYPLLDFGTRFDIPAAGIDDYDEISLPTRAIMATLGQTFGHPVIRTAFEAFMNRSSFTGQELQKPGEPYGATLTRSAEQGLLPAFGGMPGMYSQRKIADSLNGTPRGAQGRILDPEPTFADTMLGIKLIPYKPEEEKSAVGMDLKRRAYGSASEGLVSRMRALERERDLGQIGMVEYRVRRDRLRRELEMLQEASKRGRGSAVTDVLELLGVKPGKK